MSGKISLTQKYLPADCWKWCDSYPVLKLFYHLIEYVINFRLSIKTSHGTTIYDCCKSALENPDSSVGLYAPGIKGFYLF